MGGGHRATPRALAPPPAASHLLAAAAAGGGFELVSCPHYLGEVVIYAGLALAVGGRSSAAWLMLIWVVS